MPMTGIFKASETAFATIDGTHSMTAVKKKSESEPKNSNCKNLQSICFGFTYSKRSSILECDCIIDYRSGFDCSSTLSSESS